MSADRVSAVGGTRSVPAPDTIARDYLVLALRLDQHVPGLVDGYFGPAMLKAQVDLEQLRAPARLRDDAAALRRTVLDEVADPDRCAWLAAQLTALEAQAAALAGDSSAYVDHVARCFDQAPARRDEAIFDAAAASVDALVPGSGPLAERLAAWDAHLTIDPDRLPAIVDWLVARFRARSRVLFGLPDGEAVGVSLVRERPWSGYNWYGGGGRSRVDLNLDLPIRAADLVHTIAHETYPGHHLEHAWKEAALVEEAGRLESSILLINTPECLISEGLAEVGHAFAAPPDEDPELLAELYERAGLAIAADGAARETARIDAALRAPRRTLGAVRSNAALLRHVDGASPDEILAYLRRVGRFAEERAAKALEFLDHPLWRTYVFVYDAGRELLDRWLEVVPPDRRAGQFGRLLREQLTPSGVAAEIEADIAATNVAPGVTATRP
ncbi:MAG TPA: hypothetical protein VFR14_00580 [Candidatus Limnocylindrales bacterium]|nr:hypothetical protein [Candidatus Limnocylindrales bacterium]